MGDHTPMSRFHGSERDERERYLKPLRGRIQKLEGDVSRVKSVVEAAAALAPHLKVDRLCNCSECKCITSFLDAVRAYREEK